jgi:hypothetical protein
VKLKSKVNKEMDGVQIIAYFLQIHIQPLKARVSQLCNYAGSKDHSRILEEEVPKKSYRKSPLIDQIDKKGPNSSMPSNTLFCQQTLTQGMSLELFFSKFICSHLI